MIKLMELIPEVRTSVTRQQGGDSAGQLWPFAKRASYAEKWEKSRMEDLFGGSLEGMERAGDSEMSFIASINDIDDLEGHKPGGMSSDHWHIDLPDSVLGEWDIVKWMFDMSEVDRLVDDSPTKHPHEIKQGK